MQAIVTKYHGPSNIKGSRISAKAQAGRIMIEWDHGLNPSANHRAAAMALAEKFGWSGLWAAGESVGGLGYTYVNVSWADRAGDTFTITE